MEENTQQSPLETKVSPSENIRIMWLLQLAGILLPHVGWWLLVLIFYIIKADKFNETEKSVFREIINFNISFLIYFVVSFVLIFIAIGILLLPIFFIIYVVLIIISTIKYIAGEEYKFPMIMRFI